MAGIERGFAALIDFQKEGNDGTVFSGQ